MAYKIDQQDYYFGAALALFLTHNQDSQPSLIDSWQIKKTSCYELMSNTSPSFRIYMKHSETYANSSVDDTLSWKFSFSPNEKQNIQDSINAGKQIFVFLICSQGKFRNTEVVVLTQEDYLSIRHKSGIKVNWEMADKERKQSFTIPNRDGTPLSIERNRIEKKLTDL